MLVPADQVAWIGALPLRPRTPQTQPAYAPAGVALTAIVLNLLSVGAAYGLLVVVFQHTWAQDLLGFRSNGAIVSWLPLFLFVILFGLSMDYHVFVVSRIREAALRGLPVREAVAHGITSSAGVVTSAALVMVAVFGVFATLTPLDFKQMGVGLAAASLIDATVVRAVLPSTVVLLGERNWWLPRWLRWLPAPSVHAERRTQSWGRAAAPRGAYVHLGRSAGTREGEAAREGCSPQSRRP